jgi:diaminohydroxyphosphoribosylaminopyrimidine deaminase / 5-amino-6-(5-phosphoribosylamino)uracil reductase
MAGPVAAEAQVCKARRREDQASLAKAIRVPRGAGRDRQHFRRRDEQAVALAMKQYRASRAQFSDGTLYGDMAVGRKPPCQTARGSLTLEIRVHRKATAQNKNAMTDIVDCYRDSPQWLEILAAARNDGPSAEKHANALWPIYGPLADQGRAGGFVIGQLGQSLDGRIATPSGHSHYINAPGAILHLHRLRALVDAVVVGVGTAIADDPQLNVRHESGPTPARVIIDPNHRLPVGARCLRADGARRIVVHSTDLEQRDIEATVRPKTVGVEYLTLPCSPDGIDPIDVLAALARIGLRRILIEGGAVTLSRFLEAGCLNRLHVMVAPIMIGSGPTGIRLPPITSLDDALRPKVSTFRFPDGDVLFDCQFSRMQVVRNE